MTTSELIRLLEGHLRRDGDLEVVVTWEGVVRGLSADEVYCGVSYGWHERKLLIDGDSGSYKSSFSGISLNEDAKGGE